MLEESSMPIRFSVLAVRLVWRQREVFVVDEYGVHHSNASKDKPVKSLYGRTLCVNCIVVCFAVL